MSNKYSLFDLPFKLDFTVDLALLATLSAALLFVCIRLIFSRNLLNSVILLSAFSLLIGIYYLALDAPDVAMTEAALGACLSTCVLINLVKLVGESSGEIKRSRFVFAGIICVAFVSILTWSSIDLPEFGSGNTPLQLHVSKYYVENTQKDIGIPSIVAAILASYRGFDTLGETSVILIAGLGVAVILNRKRIPAINQNISSLAESEEISADSDNNLVQQSYLGNWLEKKSSILRVMAPICIAYVFLYAFYIQLNGESSPGGGFQAGVIFATGLIIYDLLYGVYALRRQFSTSKLLTYGICGVALYVGVGMTTLLMGGDFLDYNVLSSNLKGQHIGIFIIELGVGITVASIMCLIYVLIRQNQEEIKSSS